MLRIALLTAVLALAGPAAASAATYSVAPGQGACGGADLQCGSLSDAASAAMPGDVFDVAPGEYGTATFTTGGITVRGTGAGVIVNGPLNFTAVSGGTPKLQRVIVRRTASAGPALTVTGAAGLELSDSLVVSIGGHAAQITAGTTNKILRSTLITAQAGSNAVAVESIAGTPAKALTIDSSIVAGGAAGIGARTSALAVESAPGDIAITAHHLTAAGSTHGISLDASQAMRLVDPGAGNIVANVSDSIVLNGTMTLNYAGVAGLGDNTATLSTTRTRLAGDPNALFANPAKLNFHLKPGSPAIDQGGFTAGESTTDIDGDARPGPVTDQGADELLIVNRPPVAKISATPTRARQNQLVTFSAAGSADPDGPLKEYRWYFSDGTSRTTTVPQTTKSFAEPGIAGALLQVVDAAGTKSTVVAAAVRVIDSNPPVVTITKPKNGATVRRFLRGTHTRTVISFGGTASDPSGVNRVLLSLRQITKSKRCRWLNPRRGFVVRRCSRPYRFKANQGLGRWLFIVPGKRRLPAGRYELTAIGVDNNGFSGNSGPRRKVRFRLK
jgi:PKD repeat protein